MTYTTKTALEIAALLSVIQLLVQPEFGQDFIREGCDSAGVEATPENIETVILSLERTNKALAAPLIAQLPPELRVRFAKS